MILRTVRHVSLAAIVSTFTLAGACQETNEPWSTRHESIVDSGRPTLNLPPLGGETVPDVDDHPGLRAAALAILEEAGGSSDPLLRANAIEAMHYAPKKLDQFVLQGLADDNRGVRFIALMTLGKFQMTEVAHLAYPMLHDGSPSVQAAAIYALHRCGERVDLNPLAEMLRSSNPEVKANAALVLGELGNRSAIPMLRSAVGRDMSRVSSARAQVVDLQIAEAMVKLGDDRQLEVIRAALFAPAEQGEIVAFACQIVGRLGDVRALPNLMQLALREGERQLPAEVRMAATLAIAQIDSVEAPLEVPLGYVRSDQFQLRAQAALTLGAGPGGSQTQNALRRLLGDQNPMVQVFAAGGILQQVGGEAYGFGSADGNRGEY